MARRCVASAQPSQTQRWWMNNYDKPANICILFHRKPTHALRRLAVIWTDLLKPTPYISRNLWLPVEYIEAFTFPYVIGTLSVMMRGKSVQWRAVIHYMAVHVKTLISNYIHNKVWGEFTYPLQTSRCNLILHFIQVEITSSCRH